MLLHDDIPAMEIMSGITVAIKTMVHSENMYPQVISVLRNHNI